MEDCWSTTTSAKGPTGFRRHCFGSNCFSCHYIDQFFMGEGLIMSTRQQPGVHIIPQIVIYGDINVVYVQKVGSKFAQSQLRKADFTWSKDLILSFVPHTHKVLTFAQLKPPLLCTSFFACVFDTSLRFCPLYRLFDEPLLSLLPTITKRHYVCFISSVAVLLLWR